MNDEWYISRDGKDRHGPFSSAKMKELADFGKLLSTDMVWKEGMEKWVRADGLKEFFRPLPVAGLALTQAKDRLKTREAQGCLGPSLLTFLGIVFFLFGGCNTLAYLSMDTTVKVEATDLWGLPTKPERVHNLGLL